MDELTPAMKQYMEIKGKHKDCIVFFRMGDFYETFYDDAKITSEALDITLTKRGIKNSEAEIPLAGIPYHALDTYLVKMVKKGYKVAIVEQLEDPKFAKGVVKRGLVRIVTPGTLIDQNMLTKNNNFIGSIFFGDKIGVAFIDISTGEFFASELSRDDLEIELSRFSPGEIIVPMGMENAFSSLKQYFLTSRSDVDFFIVNAKESLMQSLGIASLDGYGLTHKSSAVSAAGALLIYLKETQRTSLGHINKIKYYSNQDYMLMDKTTIENLELTSGASLLKILDSTTTSMGARMLRNFLLKPLLDVAKINERLLSVEEIANKTFLLEELRGLLKNIADLERIISRVNYGNSSPRDLALLQGSLEIVPDIKKLMEEIDTPLLVKLSNTEELKNINFLINEAIVDDPPAYITEGNFIKEGFSDELDRFRSISRNAKSIINDIENKERERTKIKSLKIRYNRIFGYYIDITRANLELVPPEYIKKQTLVNSERFITEELKKLEEEILSAEEKTLQIEQELYQELVDAVKKETVKIQNIATNIAYLDVLSSYAKVALANNYTKPTVHAGYKITMKKSRHPVVERISSFVPNDLCIDNKNRVMIITGPNMAGKSVFMKQVAINIIMAQMGCFVACDYADISVVDKIFSRTGAMDDLASGQSTFMVEMAQTAQILNSATDKSLIILDEIGRGTSTYDGVAIAWAVAEHIASDIKAKTLFATHYHILNHLQQEVEGVKNYNIAVQEKEDKVIFLRKILEGGTDKSYGIHVAKLAGMPKEVIERSRQIQFKLEQDDDIAEKIVIETRKTNEKDTVNQEIEEVERMIKSKQMKIGNF
ncbi:MAG: DNA mismatch repair protein MutS [archaeon]